MKITALFMTLAISFGCSTTNTIEHQAAHGDLDAQADLGSMYASGDGVPEDDVEAVRLFRMAAEGGLPRAQFYLACMYGGGKGVEKDLEAAASWYRKAADQGMPEAQFYLACLYEDGAGVPKDLVEARRWMSLAAEQGMAEAIEYMPELGRQLTPEELEASRRFGELLEATEAQLGS